MNGIEDIVDEITGLGPFFVHGMSRDIRPSFPGRVSGLHYTLQLSRVVMIGDGDPRPASIEIAISPVSDSPRLPRGETGVAIARLEGIVDKITGSDTPPAKEPESVSRCGARLDDRDRRLLALEAENAELRARMARVAERDASAIRAIRNLV
jgi:hypothetical protein